MTCYNIKYPVFQRTNDKHPVFKRTNDKHATAAEVRALALSMSIESVVAFEQPRNNDNYRTSFTGKEFVERAKIFEKYILGKENESDS